MLHKNFKLSPTEMYRHTPGSQINKN